MVLYFKRLIVLIAFVFLIQSVRAESEVYTRDTSSKGKVIVHLFGGFDYNATHEEQPRTKFSIGRAHLGYEYRFNQKFSGKVVIDAGRATTIDDIMVYDQNGSLLDVAYYKSNGSYYSMTLKFASLQWTPNENITLQIGGILQNHYITQEKFWGYRYVAPTFQDKYYKIPSGDLGIIGYFRISDKLGIDLAVTNGEGFRFDQDSYGDVKFSAGMDYNPVKGLQTRLFYDHTKSAQPGINTTQQLLSLFAGYKYKKVFRLGAEYNYRKNHLLIDNHDLYGYSLFGSYIISKQVELFARFDNLSSNKMNGETIGWNYAKTGQGYIAGISYNAVKDVNLSINYQGWQPDNNNLHKQHHILFSFEYKL